MDDYRAAAIGFTPDSGEGCRSGERFLWRGMDGTFIQFILKDGSAISGEQEGRRARH